MSNILDKMRESAEERNERYTANIRQRFFPITLLESLTFLGNFSWTNPNLKMRFMQEDAVLYDLFDLPQTPPEIARDYLRAKYTEKRRHTKAQFAAINEPRSAPTYCRVGRYDEMAYLDLKAAYWTIVQAVGWDVDYHPSRWIGKRSINEDFPIPNHKLARNCLVTAGLMTPHHIWTGQKLKPFMGHNTLVNYDLWALAQDVLHSLATLAIRAGAVYVHTDGYIVPRKRVDMLREEFARWGFNTGIKGGGR